MYVSDVEVIYSIAREIAAIDREIFEDLRYQRKQLSYYEPKPLKPSTRLKTPLFSRRLEGGRAQRHRQKWKLRRQKVGLG